MCTRRGSRPRTCRGRWNGALGRCPGRRKQDSDSTVVPRYHTGARLCRLGALPTPSTCGGTVGMPTTDETSDSNPITYRLPLGEAWQRIRLNEHAGTDVRAYLDAVFASVPPEQAEAARGLIEGRLTTQIMAGRAKGGIDFYIPAPNVGHGPLPALTIMAAEVKIPTTAVPEPADVVARVAASNPTARTGGIAGMPAVRVDPGAGVGGRGSPAGPASGSADHDGQTAGRTLH